MVVLPLVLGLLIARAAGVQHKDVCAEISFAYVIGHVMMWAIFQLIAVPFILFRSKLLVVTGLWVAIVVAAVAVLIVCVCAGMGAPRTDRESVSDTGRQTKRKNITHESTNLPWQIFAIVLAAALVGYQIYKYIRYMHLDEDDARFVVNAVDAYNTGKMFLTHPGNGNYTGSFIGEMVKDVSSPWSIYIAMLAKLGHVHPTILAHSVYPSFLLLAGYMAYYLIGNLLTHGVRTKSFLFVAIVAAANMTFGQSVYNQSYFSLVRIWQGKAVVAGVMIPFLTYLLCRLYHHAAHTAGYILLIPAAMAMCLMSGMGIFFSGIMIGTYGIWYAVITKHMKKLPLVLLACVPTIVYGLSYALVR